MIQNTLAHRQSSKAANRNTNVAADNANAGDSRQKQEVSVTVP